MRKVCLEAQLQLGFTEVEQPELHDNDVLVQVKACGICGTDIHVFSNAQAFGDPFAHPLGHELTGEVVAVGPKVTNVKPQDRVVIDNATNCRVCESCKNGTPANCSNMENLLLSNKISFQELVVVPAQSVYKFTGLSFVEATLAEPLTVALEMLATAEVAMNQDILVLGPGPIGLMAAKVGLNSGARNVFVLGRSGKTKRLELARRFGARVVLGDQVDLVDYFNQQDIKFDRALITAPPATINQAIPLMKFGGILTYIGFDFGGKENVTLDLNSFHFNKLQLRATHAIPNRFYPMALDLIKRKVITAEDFISDTFRFDDIQQAFTHTLEEDTIKTTVVFD